jgi:hypothetical protein
MSGTRLIALAAAAALVATGCTSSNRIVGDKMTHAGHWYGELGVTGHLNNVRVHSQSRLTKLSIIGDANKVMVEDDTTLGKIEVWGQNNTISVPEDLIVRVHEVGSGTQIIRRPAGSAPVFEQPVARSTGQIEAPSKMVADETEAEPVETPSEKPAAQSPAEPLADQPAENADSGEELE